MDVTIGRRERDALWELTFTLLASVGDIFSAVDAGRVSQAREMRLRFWDLMRLLDDIGWAIEDPGEEYTLTMEPAALMRALLHLHERASLLLRDHAEVHVLCAASHVRVSVVHAGDGVEENRGRGGAGGWGLPIVASLASAWSFDSVGATTVAWFEL